MQKSGHGNGKLKVMLKNIVAFVSRIVNHAIPGKSKIEKVTIYLSVLLVAITIGALLDIFFHEFGHFCFAHAFNESAVAEFHYRPIDLFKTGEPQYVRYHGNVSDIFPLYQALFVYFGGLIFELIFFVGVFLLVSYKLFNNYKRGRSKKMLFVHGMLTGIIGGFFIMPFNGIEDWQKALNMLPLFAENMYLKILTIGSIVGTLLYIWLRCFYISCKNFRKNLNDVFK